MLSNFAILLFVIGLMISVFVRAARSRGDWTKGNNQVAELLLSSMHRELTIFRSLSFSVALVSSPVPITFFAGFV